MRISLRRPTIAFALTALLLALSAAALLAPRAGAVTFGANLNRTPDSPYRCPDFYLFAFIPTCSAESTNLSTGESGFPPVGVGVVTQVRVKVGPTTGPMQVVVEEALPRTTHRTQDIPPTPAARRSTPARCSPLPPTQLPR